MTSLSHATAIRSVLLIGLLCLAGLACGGPGGLATDPEEWSTPASPVSRWPDLSASGDELYLSWIAGDDDEAASVRFAALRGTEWSDPGTVVENEPLFVNWADFPSILVHEDRTLSAHWLVRRPGHAYAYGVRFARSSDLGASWGSPARPHGEEVPAEHGFVSMLPRADGGVDLVWLDGRKMTRSGGTMQLRAALWNGAAFEAESVLDADVCSCCQTTAVRTPDGILVAYRDHQKGEIRDISLVRRRDGNDWEAPRTLHRDGWKIGGCPVNGPSMAAMGERIALTWFTSADSQPRVHVAFSRDAGETFSAPIRIDEGDPLGRVAAEWIDDESVAVAWLETTEGGANLLLRPVLLADGSAGAVRVLGAARPSRESGFPRMARYDEKLFVAWTGGRPSRVRLVSLGF